MRTRRLWTRKEVRVLERDYPDTPTEALAERFGRPVRQVYAKAYALGLRKSRAFMQSEAAGRLLPGHTKGRVTQFKPGNAPHNKGKKGWQAGGNSVKTRFKKGNRPCTWRPIGSQRMLDGYLQRKVTDTGYPPRDWKGEHILLWEEHHGPVPDGHIVIFRDGNKEKIVIENLECITRAENMRRNTIHNLPPALADVIRLKGVLKRHITKRERKK